MKAIILASLLAIAAATPINDVPASFDWRQKGVVPPVVNQGQYGAASIFAISDVVTSAHAIVNGDKLTLLSRQQLIDCVNSTGTPQPVDIANYLVKAGGLESAADYPDTTNPGPCKFDASKIAAKVSSYGSAGTDEKALQASIYKNGPVNVMISIDNGLITYVGGIYDNDQCASTPINDILVAVGWGTENGKDFWILKQSWGTSYGENGYIRLARGKGTCNIGQYSLMFTVA